MFVTTTGLGVIPAGRVLGPELVRPGDGVLVSGTIGEHGMAVMLAAATWPWTLTSAPTRHR